MASASRPPSAPPAGWTPGLLFNGALFVFVFLAAVVASEVDGGRELSRVEASSQMRETSAEMRAAIGEMVPAGADRETFWVRRVEAALDRRDFSAARGYLISAPEMLGDREAAEILAAAEADTVGNTDERFARAALLSLSDDVRAKYEVSAKPVPPAPAAAPDSDSTTSITGGDAGPDAAVDAAVPGQVLPATLTDQARAVRAFEDETYELMGSARDLAEQALVLKRRQEAEEQRGQPVRADRRADPFLLRLEGAALAGGLSEAGGNEALAVTVIKAARRSGRLSEAMTDHLRDRLDDALPPEALEAELSAALAGIAPSDVLADRTLSAFETVLDADGLQRLRGDLAGIGELAERTSIPAAIDMLEVINSTRDLQNAAVMARAGSDRVTVLVEEQGADAFDLVRSGTNWTFRSVALVVLLPLLLLGMIYLLLLQIRRTQQEVHIHYRTHRA